MATKLATEYWSDDFSESESENSSSMEADVLLEKLYTSGSPSALRGPKALLDAAHRQGHFHISLEDCKDFLKGQESYTRFRPSRKRYPRNPVVAAFPGHIVQVDLMDMQKFAEENQGYKYVMLAYDTYTKFLAGYPLLDRSTASILQACQTMQDSLPFHITCIYSDKESALMSAKVQAWFKNRNIRHYTTTSEVKAPGVERVIRTIRLAMQKYFNITQTWRWIDYLPKFINNYNDRKHSTTKLRPLDAAMDPTLPVPTSYKPPVEDKDKMARLLPPIGAFVRLNILKSSFRKESAGTWTEEVFRVIRHRLNQPIPMAVVEDLTGERIEGSFYPQEMQEIHFSPEKRVSQIHSKRKRRGKREILVSYIGYPEKFKEWIDE